MNSFYQWLDLIYRSAAQHVTSELVTAGAAVAAFLISLVAVWIGHRNNAASKRALFERTKDELAMELERNLADADLLSLKVAVQLSRIEVIVSKQPALATDEVRKMMIELEDTLQLVKDFKQQEAWTPDDFRRAPYSRKRDAAIRDILRLQQRRELILRHRLWDFLAERTDAKLEELAARADNSQSAGAAPA
jgi:CHASE1-domain containing sensor protein